MRPDCLSIVNLISQKLIEHRPLPKNGENPISAVMPAPDNSLIISIGKDKAFYKFSVDAEGNDSWNLQLEKKNYQAAYELSRKYRPEFSN